MLGGTNYLLPYVNHLGTDWKGCLYKQRIRQKSRELETVSETGISGQRENLWAGWEHFRTLSGWLKPQGVK